MQEIERSTEYSIINSERVKHQAFVSRKDRLSKTYQLPEKDYCFLVSENEAHQILRDTVNASEDGETPHIPKLSFDRFVGDKILYKIPHYSIKNSSYFVSSRLISDLQRAWTDAVTVIEESVRDRGMSLKNSTSWIMTQFFGDIGSNEKIPESLKNDLNTIWFFSKSYGDTFSFDFSDENFLVDSKGTLILWNVLYDTRERRFQK
tara:strand:- start:2812 stop:3426 length:615 start_codon:yes stop_codon:yes gene_type:complete